MEIADTYLTPFFTPISCTVRPPFHGFLHLCGPCTCLLQLSLSLWLYIPFYNLFRKFTIIKWNILQNLPRELPILCHRCCCHNDLRTCLIIDIWMIQIRYNLDAFTNGTNTANVSIAATDNTINWDILRHPSTILANFDNIQ